MTTARILVTGALDLLGVHAAEEPLSAHQEQQGLRTLNALIQSASLEHFMVYYTPPQAVPCPIGTLMLSWGIGGEIPTPRPVQIGNQAFRSDSDPPVTRRIEVLSLAEFRSLALPHARMGQVQCITYDPNHPLGELWLWPVPMEPTTLTVYPWQILREWPEFDDEILLPPGYERWAMAACACDLAAFYDREPSNIVQGIRMEARDNIKTVNLTVPMLETPFFADPYGQWGTGDAIRSWP